MQLTAKLKDWLGSPPVLRCFFWIARAIVPAVRVRGTWMVFRAADVQELLESEEFGVSANYAARMEATTGAFFLGMEDSPLYRREQAFARAALPPEAIAGMAAFLRDECRATARALAARGEVDLVEAYSRRIPLRLVQTHFGVPGPDDATLARWLRIIFWELFLNFSPGDANVTAQARAAAQEMNAYLDELEQKRRAALRSGERPASFLDRLIQLEPQHPDLEPRAVRRNLGGVIVGAVDTLSKAFVFALQELQRRPVPWRLALEAASRDDVDACRALALEALRFRPHNPLLIRHALRDTQLRKCSNKPKPIATGERVFAWTLSASFDSRAVSWPRAFRTDRDPKKYFHFGWGVHRCFGEQLAHTFLGEALCALLSQAEPRALENPTNEGPFPTRWRVHLAPRR